MTTPARKSFVGLAVAVLIVVIAVLAWPRSESATTSDAGPTPTKPKSEVADRSAGSGAGSGAGPKSAEAAAKPTTAKAAAKPTTPESDPPSRAARDQLRAQILAAERARAEANAGAKAGPAAEEPAAPAGNLRNRTGGNEELVAHLNEDLMPLAAECIELAREREPELGGMLTVGVELLTDDELGSIVEAVEFPEVDGPGDEELQTCIRESTLSMILPPSEGEGGAFMLTLELAD